MMMVHVGLAAYLLLNFTILSSYVLLLVDEEDKIPVEVEISSGKIRGERLRPQWSNEFYHIFKGIPYAASPVGALRFQRPHKPAEWRGVMNATVHPPACIQFMDSRNKEFTAFVKAHRMSEDCLFLNVFAPAPLPNETFAVMVWIHGGGFQVGSSADYPQDAVLRHLVGRHVIVVTFNYRLGPFGFATTGDDVMPGNNGLWDILKVLEWVRENINVFAGNASAVTLVGHGSGACAASLLALSLTTKRPDLLQQVAMLSGTALSPGYVSDVAINATKRLAEHLGCLAAFNSSQVLDCIKQRTQEEIMDPRRPRVYYDDYHEWVPIVEGHGGIVHEKPEIMASYYSKTPALIGTARDEASLHLVVMGRHGVNISNLDVPTAEFLIRNLTNAYREFSNHMLVTEGAYYEYIYSRNNPNQGLTSVLKQSMLDFFGDFWFYAPAARMARYYDEGRQRVYLYSFAHSDDDESMENPFWKGAHHGSDLIALFDLQPEFVTTYSRHIMEMGMISVIYAELLTNFVKYGDPTPQIQSNPATNWTTFKPNQMNYLAIADPPTMGLGYHWRGIQFWNNYARHLDGVDDGNTRYIANLRHELNDYQMATWVLLSSAAFFLAVLVGLACYCMRKDNEEEEV